jgi:hypothetical protein
MSIAQPQISMAANIQNLACYTPVLVQLWANEDLINTGIVTVMMQLRPTLHSGIIFAQDYFSQAYD